LSIDEEYEEDSIIINIHLPADGNALRSLNWSPWESNESEDKKQTDNLLLVVSQI